MTREQEQAHAAMVAAGEKYKRINDVREETIQRMDRMQAEVNACDLKLAELRQPWVDAIKAYRAAVSSYAKATGLPETDHIDLRRWG